MQRQQLKISDKITLTEDEQKQIKNSKCDILEVTEAIFNEKTIAQFIDALKDNNRTKELILMDCQLKTEQAFSIFINRLTSATHIERLEIGKIKVSGLVGMNLSPLIMRNLALKELSIRWSPVILTNEIFDALAFDQKIILFKLENFLLNLQEQASKFAWMVKNNRTLKTLELPGLTLSDITQNEALTAEHGIEFCSGFPSNTNLQCINLLNFNILSMNQEDSDQLLSFIIDEIKQSKIREIRIGPCSERLKQHAHEFSFPEECSIAYLKGKHDQNSTIYRFFCSSPICNHENLTKQIFEFAGARKKS